MKCRILVILFFAFITVSFVSGQKSNNKISISGTVLDSYQNPVQGAVITIDGSRSEISTNKKGIYKIKIKSSAKKIGIYTLPPALIEELIDGRITINFTLNDSIVKQITRLRNEYGEEMVDIGYGTEKRKNLTSPVGKIDATQDRYSSYRSIYDFIRGELPGVQVNGTNIRIRESSSLLADTEPLFIVDNVPVNSIDDLQPQWVKSISVLKGSAASIYGVKGSNGVILISLKH